MSYKIIVARYNECIKWLENEMDNCIIYNKGIKLNIDNEVMLENVGRESETYLNYIINNYENLPDIVVFTQARINDHCVCNHDKYINYLIKLKDEAIMHSKSQTFIRHKQTSVNSTSCWDKEWNTKTGDFYLKDNYKNNNPITYFEWFKTNIIEEYPNPIFIYKAGIFAVKKELILKHTVEYYKKLILEVNHHINSSEGHFFERSWYYIFE